MAAKRKTVVFDRSGRVTVPVATRLARAAAAIRRKGKKAKAPYTAERRRRDLLKLCKPVPPHYRGAFTAYGILPHGMPLFGDGSTQCRLCAGVAHAEHLRLGYCERCLRRLEDIGKAVEMLKGLIGR